MGANIGISPIYFANRYPSAKIIALEPEPGNYAMLVRNTRPYPSITPLQVALWNHDGEISISPYDPADELRKNWAFVTTESRNEGPNGGVKVRAVSMESLLQELGLDTVDILKMDIEGAEIEIFQSADWIHRIRSLAIELHDRYRVGCSAAVDAAMEDFTRTQAPNARPHDVIWYTRKSDAPVPL